MSSPRNTLPLVEAILDGSKDQLTNTLVEIYNSSKASNTKLTEVIFQQRIKNEFKDEDLKNKEQYFTLAVSMAHRCMEFGLIWFENDKIKMKQETMPRPTNTEEKTDAQSYGPFFWAPQDKRAEKVLTIISGFIPTLTTPEIAMDENIQEQVQLALLATHKAEQLKASAENDQAKPNELKP